jgi:hypothetical protein
MPIAAALSFLGAVMVAAVFYLAQQAAMPSGLQTVGVLLENMGPILKLVLFLILAAGVATLVIGPSQISKRENGDGSWLKVMAIGAPALGLLAALRQGLIIRQAMVATGTTNLKVIAPSLAEAALVAAAGLMVGALAAALMAAIKLQRDRKAAV